MANPRSATPPSKSGTSLAAAAGASLGNGLSPAPTLLTLAIHKPAPFEPGTEQYLAVTAMFSDGSAQNYTAKAKWSSSNDALLTLLPGGLAKAGYGSGPVTITAAAPGGKPRDSVYVKVQARLQDIVVAPTNPLVESGKSEFLTATAVYADNSTEDVSAWVQWRSDSPAVADVVSIAGEWIAKAAGTATMWASSPGGQVRGSTKVTVFAAGKAPKLTSIDIAPLNPELKNGAPIQFTAVGTFADKSKHEITQKVLWESSTPDVLVIEADTGLANPRLQWGRSLVRALDPATNLHVSTTVYVETPGVVRIAVEPKAVRLAKGTATPVTVTATLQGGYQMQMNELVQWTPADPTVTEMRSGGHLVFGAAAGKTTIEAFEAASGMSDTFEVTVTPPALTDITVFPNDQTIQVGDSLPFMAIGRMTDGSTRELDKPIWSSSPPGVIDVDQSGFAVAKQPGDAVVRVEDRATQIAHEVKVEVVP